VKQIAKFCQNLDFYFFFSFYQCQTALFSDETVWLKDCPAWTPSPVL